jgi:MFS superfamily sulfate permease-like transporter
MGGCNVTINGPAAGLIVIVLEAVATLGFEGMLAASVIAGGIQVIFGLMKIARRSDAFPDSVIHGMMAAIGLIIIAKQVHILFGHTPIAKNPVMLYAEFPQAIMHPTIPVMITGLITIFFIIGWNKLPFAAAKKVPVALLAVILGSAVATYFDLSGKSLLSIPADLRTWIIFPDFSFVSTFVFWKSAMALALVGSLETVLSASAVDKLDPQKRPSNLDRDLTSKGICNMASALIGGLPMIAEIVRSSANVSYGAKTWKANFFHGVILLVAVSLLPGALAYIPLASLAAVLIMVGFRLGNPAHFIHAKKIGIDNLVGFALTLFVTLSVGLLVGIFVGFIAQTLVELFLGLKFTNFFKPSYKVKSEASGEVEIEINSALTFTNFLTLKSSINKYLAQNKDVNLLLANSAYIDHSVMENIHDMKTEFSRKGRSLKFTLSEKHKSLGVDSLSAIRKIA